MKRLLLLFALNCHALTLPSINNPAIWNVGENWKVEKTNIIAFRYSEPFENFHNGKIDVAWSDARFLIAAGFGSVVLDSIYRELEFSANIGFKPFNFLSLRVGETANISWIPENGSWQEHKISVSADFFYKEWAKISFTQINLSWLLSSEINFNSLYSFGIELPINEKRGTDFRIYQQISLGYFGIYNSFAYPGPVLGFGFVISAGYISAGAGHLRGSYPSGHTGYLFQFKGGRR
jgi:hypothetical protein